MQIKPVIERLEGITTAVQQRARLSIRRSSVALCLYLYLCCVSSWAQSVVQFASDHGEVTEGNWGNLRFSIEPPAVEPLAVVIQPLFGGDYTASASDLIVQLRQDNSLEIPAGFRSWDFWGLLADDDGVPEGDETVGFIITSISGPAALGATTNMLFTIHNRKAQVSAYMVAIEGGAAYLDLYRSGDLGHEISVTYAITNGTARPNIDYIPTNGTISIAANSRIARVDLSKVILDNGTVDGERTVLVELRQNDNGESAIIRRQEFPIVDNEIPGSLVPDFKIVGKLLGAEPNAKLLVYGRLPTGSGLGVYRTLPGGQVDPSFSISLTRPQPTAWTASLEHYQPVAAQEADGSWLVLWDEDETDAVPARLVRLQADGKLDSNFKPAVGGLSNYEFDTPPVFRIGEQQLCPQGAWPNWPLPNRQFLAHVVNKTNGQYALIRLNADGTLDSAFAPIESADGHRIQAVTATGKILIEFYSSPQGWLTASSFSLRLSDGSVDASFHGSEIGGWCDTLEIDRALEQIDGKILMCARSSPLGIPGEPPYVSKLARFLSDGKRDSTFAPVEFGGFLRLIALDSNQMPVAALNWFGGFDIIRTAIDGSLERLPFLLFSPNKYALQPDGTFVFEELLGDSGTPYIFRCDFSKTFEPRVEIRSLWDWGTIDRTPEVWESAGHYELIVRRLGDSSQVLLVRVETRDGTARAGEDYIPISQIVTFAPLEIEKRIVVPILQDQKAERDEEFFVVLTDLNNPSRSPSPLRIRILDEQPSRMFTFGPIRQTGYGWNFIRLIFNAPPTEAWHVEASTDLKNWSRAGLTGNTNGIIAREWIDAPSESFPQRFYRAVKE